MLNGFRILYNNYNLKPEIELIEENLFDDKEFFEKETFYIKDYLIKGFNLLNTTHNLELRQELYPKFTTGKKVFVYNRNYESTIYNNAREISEKLNINHKLVSANIINKRATKDYVFSFEELNSFQINNQFNKYDIKNAIIVATNLTTKEVIEFETQMEAALKLNLNFKNINNCLKGLRNSCGGFKWERKIN